MHLLASLVQLYMEGVGRERSAGVARLTCSPKQHLWLLLQEVDLRSLTYVLKSTGSQYAWIFSANWNILPSDQKPDSDIVTYTGFSLSWQILCLGYQPCVMWWTGTGNCTSTFAKWGLGFSLNNPFIPAWVMKLNSQAVLKIILFILTLHAYSCICEFTFTTDCLSRTKAYKIKTKLLSMHSQARLIVPFLYYTTACKIQLQTSSFVMLETVQRKD